MSAGIAAPTGASDKDLYALKAFTAGSGTGGVEAAGGSDIVEGYGHVVGGEIKGTIATNTNYSVIVGDKVAGLGDYIIR